MFDNPQQEVNNTSKKLRPIKLSDEAFERFYKEIYAEFGPKDVPPVELNPAKEVQEEVPAEDEVEIPAEVCQETPEELTPVQEETEAPETEAEVEAEVEEEVEIQEDIDEDDEDEDEDDTVQEEAAKAAAVIMNVQEDEVIDENTEDVTLVKPKKKGIKGLVFTICLELLAIAGIVAYWLLYIL